MTTATPPVSTIRATLPTGWHWLPDACRVARVGYSELYRYGLSGVLEMQRVGRRWCVSERSLREFMQLRGAPAPAGGTDGTD
jgi:hypothetical protein